MVFSSIFDWRSRICLAIAGVLAIWSSEVWAQGPRPEAALALSDAYSFIHMRPAEIWNSEAIAKLRQYHPDHAEAARRALEMALGHPCDEVESASFFGQKVASFQNLFGGPPQRKAPPKVDIEEKKAFERPEIKDRKDDFGFKDKKGDFGPKDKKDDFGPAGKGPAGFRPPANDSLLIVTTVKPYNRAKITPGAWGERRINGKSYFVENGNGRAIHYFSDTTYAMATSASMMEKALAGGAKTGPLSAAVELAGQNNQFVVGLNFAEPSAQEFKNIMIRASGERDPNNFIWAVAPLLEARSAAFALRSDKEAKLQAIFTFPEGAAATKGAESVEDGVQLLRILALGGFNHNVRVAILDAAEPADLAFISQVAQQLQAALRNAKTKRTMTSIQVTAQTPVDVDALRLAAKKDLAALLGDPAAQIARARRKSVDNLKNMILAMHGYHDATKAFPAAAICSKNDGKPLLSWRVAILPYVDEGPLYSEFKLDESWDSAHNIKLLPRMPKIYMPIGVKTKQPHTTFYQVLSGPGTVFEYQLKPNHMHGAAGQTMIGITDGTSNTIGIVEAADAVPWTKPADVDFDAKKPLPKIGGSQIPNGFNAAFADGTVRFISNRVDEKLIRALITRAGGEPIDLSRIDNP